MKKYKFEIIVLALFIAMPIIWTFKFLLIAVAILGVTFMIYCFETAQLVDECFQPLEPQKHFKDTETTKLIVYLIIFFTVVHIVSSLLYSTCTLF